MLRKHGLTILGLALAITALGLPQARAQSSSGASGGVERAKFDAGYVPPTAVAVVAAYPRGVMMSKDLELLPREIITAACMKEVGFDPVDIDQIMAVAEAPGAGPPSAAVIAHFIKPLAKDKLLPMLMAQTTEADLGGKPYHKAKDPMSPSVYQVDDNTLIVGSDDLLKKIVANHATPQEGKLSAMLGRVGKPDIVALVDVEPLRPLISAAASQQPLPPPLAGLAKVPDQVKFVAAKLDLTGDMNMVLTVRANDDQAAEQVESAIDGAMTFGKQMASQQMAPQAAGGDVVLKAQCQYAERAIQAACVMFKPVRKGPLLTLAGSGKESFQRIITGLGGAGFLAFTRVSPPANSPGPVDVQAIPLPVGPPSSPAVPFGGPK